MFGKLLKYEFKNVNKWYLALYAATLGLSIILGFWIDGTINGSLQSAASDVSVYNSIPLFLTVLTFGVIIAALFISTFFLIILRFKNNVYGREGYLTLTLPVTEHQIILSKLLSALIWTFLSTITFIISVGIIALILASNNHINISELLKDVEIQKILTNLLPYTFSKFIETISEILLVYLAISFGQLFENYRTAIAIAFYLLVSILPSALFVLTTTPYIDEKIFLYTTMSYNIITALLFYFGTYYILKNKVNLH